jgi:flagellar M-ring protein FliF
MADSDQPLQQMKTLWAQMSPMRRLTTVGLLVGTLVLFAVLIHQGRQANYRVLFRNLSEADSAAILEELRTRDIPFKVTTEGSVIRVPGDRQAELRVDLASHITASEIGFEIFDQSTLGWTDFMQRVNHIRALQGELTATLRRLEMIEWAKVHVTLPDEEIFVSERSSPTASVLVRLHPGQRLSNRQVQGIVQLVASAVPDLSPEAVSVIDAARGLSLTLPNEDPMAAQGSYQELVRRGYEEQRAQRIVAQLEPLVGEKKVIATVAATFDFSEQTTQSTELDRPQARSKTTEIEINGVEQPNPAGVIGSDAELGEEQIASLTEQGGNMRQETRTENTMGQTTTSTTRPGGRLMRQTASVTIHHRTVEETGDAESADPSEETAPTLVAEPWTAEELTHFEELVKSAIEFDSVRGDQVTVVSLPFIDTAAEALDDSVYEIAAKRQWIVGLVRLGLVAGGALVLFLFVLRPVTREVIRPALLPQPAGPAGLLGHRVSDLEAAVGEAHVDGDEHAQLEAQADAAAGGETPKASIKPPVRDEGLNQSIREMTQSNPAEAAQIIKSWLDEAN